MIVLNFTVDWETNDGDDWEKFYHKVNLRVNGRVIGTWKGNLHSGRENEMAESIMINLLEKGTRP